MLVLGIESTALKPLSFKKKRCFTAKETRRNDEMLVLGIESTAHTLGVGIAERKNGKIEILANENAKYPVTEFIPRKLADHHAKAFKPTLEKALAKAHVSLENVDAFAYSQGPGIGHCLHLGFVAASALSARFNKPIIPVNHVVAHVEVVKWACKARDPLIVFASGGNTQLIARQGNRYHVFGETLDIGVGNFLDKLGRGLKLDPPDAIGVIKAAGKSREFIDLPYTVKGMDLAFSGLLTASLASRADKNAVAYSAQETAFAMVAEASERALRHADKKELLVCGGVAQNKRFIEMMKRMAKDAKCRFLTASNEFNGDNGGQIALTGALMVGGSRSAVKNGGRKSKGHAGLRALQKAGARRASLLRRRSQNNGTFRNIAPRQKTRVEDVEISWRN